MNRRHFLVGLGKFLGAAAAVEVAPKFVFDVGASLPWRRAPSGVLVMPGSLTSTTLFFADGSRETHFFPGSTLIADTFHIIPPTTPAIWNDPIAAERLWSPNSPIGRQS